MGKLRRWLAIPMLTCIYAMAQSPVPAPAADRPNRFTQAMGSGADSYVEGHFDIAARYFQSAVRLDPTSGQAQYWAGQSLVYGRRPGAAVAYLEAAQRLGVDSVALHLALVSAYAGAGLASQRDRERALLQAWHDQPAAHPSIARQSGFLVETFYAHSRHVNAMEYYGTQHGQDVVWRFTVRDTAEVVERTYYLEHNGTGYDLVSVVGDEYGRVPGDKIQRYGGLPTYDEVRARVVRELGFHLLPH